MKLVSFSIHNYRSITCKSDIPLDSYTVLVGRNNEGKTNILRALHVAFDALDVFSGVGSLRVRVMRGRHLDYEWFRDFPIVLQKDSPGGSSEFMLVFELSQTEVLEAQEVLGFGIPRRISVLISIGRVEVVCAVRYDSNTIDADEEAALQLMRLINGLISNVYIPAVRTERTARNALQRTIDQRMRVLEHNEEYVKALDTVERLRRVELERISAQLIDPLKVFLPSVLDVELIGADAFRHRRLQYGVNNASPYEVFVDDGTMTPIGQKGDGIQSLMALAILRGSDRGTVPTVLEVEEPESHLHPSAIRELQGVLRHIADEQGQVIVSTHNPIFVKREDVSSNIVVERGGAHPAKNLAEIRQVLGVSLSDNLINAEKVILVEGMADRVFLEKVLPWGRSDIGSALESGLVAIKEMGGIDNLPYELIHLQGELCDFVVLCDNDDEGKNKVSEACQKGLVRDRLQQVVMMSRTGCKTELEDFLAPEFYIPLLRDELMVDFGESDSGRANYGIITSNKGKWSDRVKRLCENNAIACDGGLLAHLKTMVSEAVRLFDGDVTEMITDDSAFINRLIDLAFNEG